MKKCDLPIWYHDRKNGQGKDCPLQIDKLRNKTAYEKTVFKSSSLGRDYMSNDEVFQYLESLMTKVKTDMMTGIKEARKSYLYIISKKIGDEVYRKSPSKSPKQSTPKSSGFGNFQLTAPSYDPVKFKSL